MAISIADFSRLQRHNIVNRWNIERVLRGDRHLDQSEAEALQELCQELRDLAAAFPIPINWTEVGRIQNLLARRREQARQLTAPNSKTPLPIIEHEQVSLAAIDQALNERHL